MYTYPIFNEYPILLKAALLNASVEELTHTQLPSPYYPNQTPIPIPIPSQTNFYPYTILTKFHPYIIPTKPLSSYLSTQYLPIPIPNLHPKPNISSLSTGATSPQLSIVPFRPLAKARLNGTILSCGRPTFLRSSVPLKKHHPFTNSSNNSGSSLSISSSLN